jgi:hypothetical protein
LLGQEKIFANEREREQFKKFCSPANANANSKKLREQREHERERELFAHL